MKQTEIYDRLNALFNEVFLREDIKLSPATTAADIEGRDSFRHIELMLVIETRFNIQFHSCELDEMKNIGDLIRVIERHLTAA